MKHAYTFLLAVVVSLASNQAFGQFEATAYFMNSLPQSVNANPAFVPKYKFALGLPVSSIMLTYTNNGFSYNDLIKKENGQVTADLSQWVSRLPDKSFINLAAQADVFRLGIRINPKLYITLNSTAKAYTIAYLPKDLAALFVDGTSPYVGRVANLSPEVNGISYLENALGFSAQITKELRIGARLKYINGGVAAKTEKSQMQIAVAEDYKITATADALVKTSGVYDLDNSNSVSASDYLKNTGWGIDLGATYRLFDRITLAASLVDIGQINFKNNTYEYRLNPQTANYTFSGIDVDELFDDGSDYFDAQIDSLEENFDFTESPGGSFSSALPTKAYLSGSFDVTKSFTVGAIFFAEKFANRFNSGFSLAMNKHFRKVLTTSVSYTVTNRSFNNLGAGLSLNLAPIQIYVVGDNLLTAPISLATSGEMNSYLNNTQVFTVRTGINFVWGWIKDEDKDSYNKRQRKGAKEGNPEFINSRQKKRS